tara:strand:- start:1179 stop:1385 length:207 start_codon:yes stop_codon:yes gene_type:complete
MPRNDIFPKYLKQQVASYFTLEPAVRSTDGYDSQGVRFLAIRHGTDEVQMLGNRPDGKGVRESWLMLN